MSVHLLFGFPKGRIGRPLAHLLLRVAAAWTLHDQDGFQIVVAAVGIGRIVRKRNPLEEIGTPERAIVTMTTLASGLTR
ncbi:MAG: hypothetical protein ACREIN_04750 [Candidatus Methylomirabilaceae bacterium]